jgi:hypothetical protein
MKKHLELVFVKWIDSESLIGWEALASFGQEFQCNLSVGFLIGEDDEKYILAADYDPECLNVNRVIRIPKSCVRKLRTVTLIRSG